MLFYVEDMSCSHCQRALEQSLSAAGVRDFEVDLRTKSVRVHESVSREVIEKAIREAGYTSRIMNEQGL
ncbi:MAG TPA: heavy-metal-associated domain-containing protein [bacterium]|nr:heavy-metal-associated domain-containing protein [bacterium]